MPFSAFARFGNGFRFSGKQPVGQTIYESLRDGMGAAYEEDFDGRQQARLFAQAMCLSAAQYEVERAGNQQNPLTADELLPALERDYQVVPRYTDTKNERRRVLDARRKVTRGSRAEAVEDALRTLLGDAFIAYEPTPAADAVVWPATMDEVGVFARAGAQKKVFRLNAPVVTTGVAKTVSYTSIGGTDAPLAGEFYTVDPDSRCPSIEKILLTAATPTTITAVFTKAHRIGAVAARPHPLIVSTKRYNRIVVTLAAATDPETRRKIAAQMRRQLRGVSRWCIVSDEGTFLLDDPDRGILDATGLA